MVKMSAVWDRTAEFLSDNLPRLLPVALLAFFVPASIEGSLPSGAEVNGTALAILLPLMSLVFAVISVWGSLTIVAMATDPDAMDHAGATARARLLPALMVWVVLFVVLMLLLVPVPAALALNGYDLGALARGEDVTLTGAMAWPLFIYGLLLAAAMFWASARLLVVSPLIVREGRMFDAIPISVTLTHGLTWRIIGVILLFGMVTIVSMLAAQTVFGSIFRLVAGDDGGPITLAGVLTSVAVAGVQTAFSVIAPAFSAKLYVALRSASPHEARPE